MKFRLIASLLVIVVVAALAVLSEPSAPSVSAPSSVDDSSLKSFKMP